MVRCRLISQPETIIRFGLSEQFHFIHQFHLSYYTRIFCRAAEKPTVTAILEHLETVLDFDISTNLSPEEAGSGAWTTFELHYDEDRLPVLVECNYVSEDETAREEIAEFIEQIEDIVGADENSGKVITHLRATCFIIACQLPVSDIDDDGYDANGELMNFVATNCDGLIQADGEGFYDGEKLLIPLD